MASESIAHSAFVLNLAVFRSSLSPKKWLNDEAINLQISNEAPPLEFKHCQLIDFFSLLLFYFRAYRYKINFFCNIGLRKAKKTETLEGSIKQPVLDDALFISWKTQRELGIFKINGLYLDQLVFSAEACSSSPQRDYNPWAHPRRANNVIENFCKTLSYWNNWRAELIVKRFLENSFHNGDTNKSSAFADQHWTRLTDGRMNGWKWRHHNATIFDSNGSSSQVLDFTRNS